MPLYSLGNHGNFHGGTDAFLSTWILTDMNFSEPFQTVTLRLLSYLVVRIINHMRIINHRSHENHQSHVPFPSKSSLWLWRVVFQNFQKITIKKQRVGVYIFLRRRSGELIPFLGNFLEFPEQTISRVTVNNCLWTFWHFFSKLFSCSFFWFGAIYRSLVLWETLIIFKILL